MSFCNLQARLLNILVVPETWFMHICRSLARFSDDWLGTGN